MFITRVELAQWLGVLARYGLLGPVQARRAAALQQRLATQLVRSLKKSRDRPAFSRPIEHGQEIQIDPETAIAVLQAELEMLASLTSPRTPSDDAEPECG